MINVILLSVFTLFTSSTIESQAVTTENTGDVIVRVTDIQDIKGEILVGIYDSRRTFRKVKKVMKYAVKEVSNGTETLVLEDVPAGTYAIALFQDFNGNRKFDSNWMGVPKEPFGFSTNYVVKRRAPKYKEVTFEHPGNENTEMTINIQVW